MRLEPNTGRGNGGQNDNPCEDSSDKKPVICELVIVFSFPSPPFSSHCSFFVVIPHQSHAHYTLTSNLSANHTPFVEVAGRCNLLHYKVLTFRFNKWSNTFSAFTREETEKSYLNVYQSYLITCNKLTLSLEHFYTIFIPFLFHFYCSRVT